MMVGDRMATDVVAGIEAGLDTILDLTGSRPSRTSRSICTGRAGLLHPSPR
jgi:ribonucleotide monophosphatase NagD (HAD superfamily)